MQEEIRSETLEMLDDIVTNRRRHRGKYVAQLEEEFAKALGAERAVTMNSAMSVLHASVMASGAGPGDEVIVDPVMVFGAVAVMYADAIPVFADIKRHSMNVDPESIRSRITERTKAIICTHCWGNPCELDRITEIAKEHGLLVIEDAAHAIFAEYGGKCIGTWGDIGSFSFCEKHIGTGDGAVATTHSDDIVQHMLDRSGPTWGSVARFRAWNYRMNEMTAAVAIPQVRRGREIVGRHQEGARILNEAIDACPWLVAQEVPPSGVHAYLTWAAVFDGAEHGVTLEDFKKALAEVELKLGFGYTGIPGYEHPAVKEYLATGRGRGLGAPLPESTANQAGSCPVAEALMPDIVTAGCSDPESAKANAEKLREAVQKIG